jgi:hypothetical protein
MRVAANRLLVAGLLCALAICTSGCASPQTPTPGGSSGMGMDGGSASGGMGAGVIAASRDASMSTPVFESVSGTIRLPRVLAPADGWVVGRSAITGGVLGATPVAAGENRDVALQLAAIDGRQVRVALFVDRGARGVLEFDADRPSASLDKPVSVDGAPVESSLTLSGWGAETDPNTVLVMVEGQPAGATLEVGYLLVPTASWVEVRRIEKGVPGPRLGLILRPAGEFQGFAVPIEGARAGDELLVTVHADRGTLGVFEPGVRGCLSGVDQPWVAAGVAATQRVRLR